MFRYILVIYLYFNKILHKIINLYNLTKPHYIYIILGTDAPYGQNGDEFSIDIRISNENGGTFEALNIEWKGKGYNQVINLGKPWGIICDASYQSNGSSAKVGFFDFSNYNASNWGVFIAVLIVIILAIIGIIFMIIKGKNKTKPTEQDIEIAGMMGSTINKHSIMATPEGPSPSGEGALPGNDTVGGDFEHNGMTQGNIIPDDEESEESIIAGDNVTTIGM